MLVTVRRKTLRKKFLLISLIFLLRIVLDLSYICAVAPYFESMGFILKIKAAKVVESYILTGILSLFLPHEIKKPSDFCILLLFLLPVLPTLSLYGLTDAARAYTYMLALAFLTVMEGRRLIPLLKLARLKDGRKLAVISAAGIILVTVLWLIARGGLNYFNLDLVKVYDYRRTVDAVVNIGIWGYINTWTFKVFNPLLISWSLFRKNYPVFVFSLLLQILLFGISSHKSVLFYPVLILALYFFIERRYSLHLIVMGIVGIIGISDMPLFISGQIFPVSLFIRRLMYVPALLNYAYYELFSQNGLVYWTTVKPFSFFFEYPFDYPPPQLVSLYLWGHTNTWANNGFLATSYMHFGFVGMVIFSLIIGMLLRLIDILVRNRLPLWFGLSLVVVPLFSLFTSADLTTALLNHGLGISMFLLWLFSSREGSILRVRKGDSFE